MHEMDPAVDDAQEMRTEIHQCLGRIRDIGLQLYRTCVILLEQHTIFIIYLSIYFY